MTDGTLCTKPQYNQYMSLKAGSCSSVPDCLQCKTLFNTTNPSKNQHQGHYYCHQRPQRPCSIAHRQLHAHAHGMTSKWKWPRAPRTHHTGDRRLIADSKQPVDTIRQGWVHNALDLGKDGDQSNRTTSLSCQNQLNPAT